MKLTFIAGIISIIYDKQFYVTAIKASQNICGVYGLSELVTSVNSPIIP